MELGLHAHQRVKNNLYESINRTFNDAMVNTIGVGERRFNVLSTFKKHEIFDEQVFKAKASSPCTWLVTQMPNSPIDLLGTAEVVIFRIAP